MGAETIVTLVAVFLTVAVLAAYLITIAASLNRVSFTLGTVLIGVRAIAHQTSSLDGVVGGIVNDIEAIEEAMASTVGATPARRSRTRR